MGTGLEELGIVDDELPIEWGGGLSLRGKIPEVDHIEELERIALFAGLLPAHLVRIGKLAVPVTLQKEEHLFRHGDPANGLYLILTGSVRISRNTAGVGEEALAVLHKGQHFGEMSVIDEDVPRSTDAIGHENTRLLMVPKNELRDLMFVDRELAYELLWRFVRTLSARLRDSNDRLMMLTASSKF